MLCRERLTVQATIYCACSDKLSMQRFAKQAIVCQGKTLKTINSNFATLIGLISGSD
jgi:hypothetical protein